MSTPEQRAQARLWLDSASFHAEIEGLLAPLLADAECLESLKAAAHGALYQLEQLMATEHFPYEVREAMAELEKCLREPA